MFQRQRLEEVNKLISEAQTFASESLGMHYPEPLSITQAKEDVLYDLYASPKLKLFYDYSEIQKESDPSKRRVNRMAKDYKRRGYDTLMTTLQAYEGDGIFLTKKILKNTNPEIVGTVVHELLHTQLDLDRSIEESIASTVESLAVVSFYEQKEGKSSPNYEKAVIEDNLLKVNDGLIIQYYILLYDVYKQEIPDGEKLKAKKELCKEAESKLIYDYKLNNASLTYYMTYSRYTNEIREVCKYSNSLKDAVEVFKSLPHDRIWAYRLIREFISANKK
ncbi:MAG: aminopeptidase [Nanoarchaeota archaeon]|nr:aminopeptidase [Nanoarchaeota archaeon]